jgi:putative ABC transport system permease protein
VVAAARFGNVLDWAGPNLAADQVIVYAPGGQGGQPPPGSRPPASAQLAAMPARARGIAALLGSGQVIPLDAPDAILHRNVAGRNWDGQLYLATPRLLRAFGISAGQVSPDADVLSMRPGLAGLSGMEFLFGSDKFGPGSAGGFLPCPRGDCRADPPIQELSELPSGTSAPNTVVTEHAARQFHLSTTTVGWLIQTPGPLTASQVSAAQHAAAAAGLTVETRDSIPSSAQILDAATIFGIVLALGILGMSTGLLRSETSANLRILTATGASRRARRAISATTAGALALIGAVAGTVTGYVAAIGFFRTSQLDTLTSLTSIPVANLLLILVGMPLIAAIAGWLLAGRDPVALGRRPLE